MRKALLAAAAIAALASASATAQNVSPDSPANGTAAGNDKMNSSANQGARRWEPIRPLRLRRPRLKA